MAKLDSLVRTVIDPLAECDCAWAWALDHGAHSPLLVRILESLVDPPKRTPLTHELFLWFGAPRQDALPVLLSLLSDVERGAALRFRYDVDRLSFASARVALRTLLANALDCGPQDVRFVLGKHGKPALDRQGRRFVHFNVSHTRGLVAIAIAGRAVGVDVERHGGNFRDLDAVAETAFARESTTALVNTPVEEARTRLFYRFWTLGEAFIKATGEGISQGLHTFAFTPDGVPELTRVCERWGPTTRWRFGGAWFCDWR